MSKEDSEVLGWYAQHVMTNNPEFFGTPESWDPKLRRGADMAKKSLSINDVGNVYEMPALTKEEMLTIIAQRAYNRALLSWGEGVTNARLTINDRVLGAVYSTFELLQEGREGLMPPMELVPHVSEDIVVHIEREGHEVACCWPEDPVLLAPDTRDATSMTAVFSTVYDRYKDRLAASARDLFQTYE